MGSTFSGFDIARTSLTVHNTAIDIAAHNISNANTPGYSRQVATFRSIAKLHSFGFTSSNVPANMGCGVEIASIDRVRDDFIDYQVRWELSQLGSWQMQAEGLEQIERIFGEPSENSLQNALTRFANALDELSKRPESSSTRGTVREEAKALCNIFNHIHMRLQEQGKEINYQIETKVSQINSYAEQIRDLNIRIMELESIGQHALDLRDRRDLLIDELSKLVRVDVTEQKPGMVTVRLDDRNLVEGKMLNTIVCESDGSKVNLLWADTKKAVNVDAGEIGGLIQLRDEYLDSYITQLNNVAHGIITWFNEEHAKGYGLDFVQGSDPDAYTPVDFFTGSSAADMGVSSEIQTDLQKIAAAGKPGEDGDGDNAARLATFLDNKIFDGNMITVKDYYVSLISRLGVDSAAAAKGTQNQEFIVSQVTLRQESVSGVSTDEELSDIIRFQHAYNAAARVITALDEMLDTLINRMAAR
jgi:flagellar hook-associated protein 1 FlgK